MHYYIILVGYLFLLVGCFGPLESKKVNRPARVNTARQDIAYSSAAEVYTVKTNRINQILPTLPEATSLKSRFIAYRMKQPPRYGTLSGCMGIGGSEVDDRSCFYYPKTDAEVDDLFIYQIYDQAGQTIDKTVVLRLRNNSPPTITDQYVRVVENGGLQSLGTLQSATDLDDENGSLKYAILTFPSKGVLSNCFGLDSSLGNSLYCNYTPNSDESGLDTFVYRVFDGFGGSVNATVTIDITSTNTAPTVVPTSMTVSVKANRGFQSFNVIPTTVTDIDGSPPDSFTYEIYSMPLYGDLKNCLNLAGSTPSVDDFVCDYYPPDGVKQDAYDSFIYMVKDGQGGITLVTVTIDVTNTIPSIDSSDEEITVLEDGGAQAANIVINDGGEGDITSIEVISPLNGSGVFDGVMTYGTLTNCLTLAGSASALDVTCSYNPNSDVSGSRLDQLVFRVTDNSGETADLTVYFTVTAVADAPVLASETVVVKENAGAQLINVTPATDADGTLVFTYNQLTNPVVGTLASCQTLTNPYGKTYYSCLYTPPANGNSSTIVAGNRQFTLEASDGVLTSAVATITIDISSTNIPPTFVQETEITVTPAAGPPTTVAGAFTLPTATDLDAADTVTYTITGGPGAVHLSGCVIAANTPTVCDYDWVATLKSGTRVEYVTYTVDDGEVTLNGVVWISIAVTDTAPTFAANTQTVTVVENILTPQILSAALDQATDVDYGDQALLRYYLSTTPTRGKLSSCLGLDGTDHTSSSLNCYYKINSSALDDPNLSASANFDTFTYVVFDPKGNKKTHTVFIQLTPVAQDPMILQLSNVTGYVNAKSKIDLVIDEGGLADENAESLTLCVQDLGASTVLNPAGVAAYRSGTLLGYMSDFACDDAGDFVAFGDGAANAGGSVLTLVFYPIDGASNDAAPENFRLNIDDGTLTASEDFTVEIKDQRYLHGGFKDIYAAGSLTDRTAAVINSEVPIVNFGWESFSTDTHTQAIAGYNVYRSFTGMDYGDFDLMTPVNGSTLVTTTAKSISETFDSDYTTDLALASNQEGRVSFYKVYAVNSDGVEVNTEDDLNFGTGVANVDGTLRIVIPPTNMSLVHRFEANRRVCTLLGKTPDKNNMFSCSYVGPGNRVIGGTRSYDLGYDLLVDRMESGCPYDFIDNDTPIVSGTVGVNGDFYHDRFTGDCYVNTAAVWSINYGSAFFTTAPDYLNVANLPPIAGITQGEAANICDTRPDHNLVDGSGFYAGAVSGRLLSRKEFVVGSLFSSSLSEGTISQIETGSNLLTNTYCNSSSGGGLAFYDALQPTTISSYPSAASGSNKALSTASDATRSCVSIFGLYDMIGNLNEWNSDRLSCTTDQSCISAAGIAPLASVSPNFNFESNAGVINYQFDGVTGPCLDSDEDGVCDVASSFTGFPLTSLPLPYLSTKFFLPIGLPAVTSIGTAPFYLNDAGVIGTGISTSLLHGDSFFLDASGINATGTNGGDISSGGGFLDGESAGSYYFKAVPRDDISTDTGFRCAEEVVY